jgi:MtaA/CmuA family methyltransferase
MTGRERVIAMMEGRPTDCLPFMPITMMFAADRIGAKYGQYAKDYRVMTEAQLRVAEEFDIDTVSTISDPAREASDYGAEIEWFDDQPPALVEAQSLLADATRLLSLKPIDPLGGGRIHDRIRGVERLRQSVGSEKTVEGWVEGPCAEGADLRGINRLMIDFHDSPEFVHDLFSFIVDNALVCAQAQMDAGADYIGVGDAAASLVGPKLYEAFVLPYEKKLVDGIHAAGGRVRLHICGSIRRIADRVATLGCDMVDIDYPVPMREARAKMGPQHTIAGNLDPVNVVRNGTPETITAALEDCLMAAGPRYIVGAGCEIVRDTPPENLRAMLHFARSYALVGECHR